MIFGREKSRKPDPWEMWKKQDVSGLIKALEYMDEPSVRWNAADFLGRIGDTRAVEPLIQVALNDPHTSVRVYAIDALGHGIGYQGTLGSRVRNDPRVVEAFLKALNDPNQGIRGAAASNCNLHPDPRAVEPLLRILSYDDSAHNQSSAMRALRAIGQQAEAPLTRALSDDDEKIRKNAQTMLNRIEEDKASKQ
jgi:HEAT repeat protein